MQPTANRVWWFLVALAVIRLAAMVWVPLTDPTEARYAEIARKMVETGNWITPQFDYGVPFWAKPPLHTWLSALGMMMFGATPFAARLFIFAASLALLYLLWRWVRETVDAETARLAVVITATSALFFGAAAYVMTDMVLALGLVLCLTGFFGGLSGARGWGWLFFVGVAVGLLAKGPVATVLAGMPIGAFMLWRGGWRDLLNLPWLGGTTLVLLTVLPWYIAAEMATPGFLRYFLIGEHIERFLVPGWQGDLYGAGREHARGMVWLYFLLCALPWSLFIPELLFRLRRGIPTRDEKDGLYVYLLFWAMAPLVLFTFAANILPAYVLPALPAAAVLGVLLWRRTGPGGGARAAAASVIMAVLFAVTTIGVTLYPIRDLVPSQARFIADFSRQPGHGRLALLGDRSFSAEFHTQGQIPRLPTLDDLDVWLRHGSHDGVLVPRRMQEDFLARFGSSFEKSGSNHKYALFVEKS